jgi:hypothetical protein
VNGAVQWLGVQRAAQANSTLSTHLGQRNKQVASGCAPRCTWRRRGLSQLLTADFDLPDCSINEAALTRHSWRKDPIDDDWLKRSLLQPRLPIWNRGMTGSEGCVRLPVMKELPAASRTNILVNCLPTALRQSNGHILPARLTALGDRSH